MSWIASFSASRPFSPTLRSLRWFALRPRSSSSSGFLAAGHVLDGHVRIQLHEAVDHSLEQRLLVAFYHHHRLHDILGSPRRRRHHHRHHHNLPHHGAKHAHGERQSEPSVSHRLLPRFLRSSTIYNHFQVDIDGTAACRPRASITSPLLRREHGDLPTTVVLPPPRLRRLDPPLPPDVPRELAHVLRERGRSVDLEVRHDLRAEPLTKDETPSIRCSPARPARARRPRGPRGVSEHDALADVRLEAGACPEHLGPARSPASRRRAVSVPLRRSMVASHMSVAGRADRTAERRVDERCVGSWGRAHLL